LFDRERIVDPRSRKRGRVRRLISITTLLTAALAAVSGVVVPAVASASTGTAPGGIGLRLLDVPVSAGSDPRAQLYIVDHLAPGATIERRVEVSNTTASTMRVELYSSAATIANGSFLGASGHTPDELSTWTSVTPRTITIAPGGTSTATVTVAIPRNAAPGERYGVVWAQTRTVAGGPAGVVEVSRVGIRLYVSVGPGGAPAAAFTIDSVTAARSADGSPEVFASVRNTGGRALDMSGTLQLLGGPGSLTAGPFSADLGTTLAIGDTERVTFVLDAQLPAGPWDAKIVLRSGLLQEQARATISFPALGSAPPVRTGSSPTWLFAGLFVVILGLAASVVLLLRRRRRGTRQLPAFRYPPGPSIRARSGAEPHPRAGSLKGP
jgi:hypothetical protein